jgi:hypothetical protein
MTEIELDAELDEGVEGVNLLHYIFPGKIRRATSRAANPVTGGLYIVKSTEVPDRIIINLRKEKNGANNS